MRAYASANQEERLDDVNCTIKKIEGEIACFIHGQRLVDFDRWPGKPTR
jgi:hypothetical protein